MTCTKSPRFEHFIAVRFIVGAFCIGDLCRVSFAAVGVAYIDVVVVDVRVSDDMNEVSALEPADVREQAGEQRVGGDVEGHAEAEVGGALRTESAVGVGCGASLRKEGVTLPPYQTVPKENQRVFALDMSCDCIRKEPYSQDPLRKGTWYIWHESSPLAT